MAFNQHVEFLDEFLNSLLPSAHFRKAALHERRAATLAQRKKLQADRTALSACCPCRTGNAT
jgi:hypothetical protein